MPDRPARHRADRQLNVCTGEEMLLAVQGLVVAVLADHHLRHKAGFCYTFRDELCRQLTAEHLFTAGASILRSNVLTDHEARRDERQLFADFIADEAKRHTAVATGFRCRGGYVF